MKRTGITMAGLLVLAGGVVSQTLLTHAAPPPLVLGELPYQKMLSRELTDRSGISVNVANGNLLLKTQDLTLQGPGPQLSITRYFNDRGSGAGQTGQRGTLSVGADINLTEKTNGSVVYQGPSGYQVTFQSDSAGGYTTPAEFTAATLAKKAGGGWTLTYNKSGEVFTFNSAGLQTKHANNAGLAITYTYNSNGTLATATDAQGKTVTFSNYSGSKVGTITGPQGRTVEYQYNAAGQLSDVTDTNGDIWHFEYWDGRNLTWMVDPMDRSTTFNYDSSNRLTTINYNEYTSEKTTWTYTYNSNNTVVTDPLGHDTTYHYDGNGRVIKTVNPVGDKRETTWDANNNPTSVKDSFGHTTTLTYDTLNNMIAMQKPTTSSGGPGAVSTHDFTDTIHPYLLSKETDVSGNTVAYSYNVNGNVATATSADAAGTGMGVFTYAYQGDPKDSGGTVDCGAKTGQLCTMTDARDNTTTYSYDTNGNLTTVTPPGPVGAQTYTYDNLSRVKTYTDGNGSKVTITYDNANRPTQLTYAQDGSTVSYTYDAAGNLTQRVDDTGTTNWTYDGYNRVTKLQQPNQPDLNYTYDDAGNLKTEQGPGGTTTYRYDAANQVTRVTQPSGANQDFVYQDGKIVTAYLPGDIVQQITYDNAGRQTSIKAVRNGVTLTHYTGTYTNATGGDAELLDSETDHVAGVTHTYEYDGLNRLVAVNGSGSGSNDYTYEYDMNGNRTQQSKNGVYSAIYGYNAANQMVTDGGAPSGTFDQAGNQTSTGTGLSFDYNAKNQTSEFTPPNANPITASYSDTGQTGRTQMGAISQLNGLLGLYSDALGGTSVYYTRMPGGTSQVLGQTIGSNSYYYLTDLRGSVVKMTDENGNVVNTYSYSPYGQTLSSTGSTYNPHRYVGGYYDSSTKLYKFGARYYNPTDARWTQLDPSGQNFGYLYAGNNPVNYFDPSGLVYVDIGVSICSGIYFVCGSAGIQFGNGGINPYIGAGVGLSAGVGGAITINSGRTGGLSAGATCAAGPLVGSVDPSGQAGTGFQFIPAKFGCDVQVQYAF